jgi:hypothetical protein
MIYSLYDENENRDPTGSQTPITLISFYVVSKALMTECRGFLENLLGESY